MHHFGNDFLILIVFFVVILTASTFTALKRALGDGGYQ